MALVKARGNKSTELALIQQFRANGVKGWRRKWKLVGKPDFVFPMLRLAIFVDGCFWHGCTKHRRIPKSNSDYWIKKIKNNMKREKVTNKALRNYGWQVVRVWEHDIDNERGLKKIRRILKTQQGDAADA